MPARPRSFRRGRTALGVAVTLALTLTAPRASRAEGEGAALAASPYRPHWELGAIGGYTSPPIRGGTTPFGVGLGGRLAYAPSAWVVGVSVVGFLGGSDVGSTNAAWRYGGELGRSFAVPMSGGWSFVLRPHVGAGGVTVVHTDPVASTSTVGATGTPSGARSVSVVTGTDVITSASSRSSGSSSPGGSYAPSNVSTVSSVYVEPGLALLFMSGSFYAGGDVSAFVVPSIAYGGSDAMTWVTYGVTGHLGLVF